MVAVSELVEDVAEVLNQPRESVSAYARALIDAGLLPKSRGRAVAHVERAHVIRLFLAVALAPKIKSAARTVEQYAALRLRRNEGGWPNDPDTLKALKWPANDNTLEAFLLAFWSALIVPAEPDLRHSLRKSRIEIFEQSPKVSVALPGAWQRFTFLVFIDPYDDAAHWQGYLERSAVLRGQAFVMLGHKSGRDYHVSAARARHPRQCGAW